MDPDPLITKQILEDYDNNIITEAEMRARLIANHFDADFVIDLLSLMEDDVIEEETTT